MPALTLTSPVTQIHQPTFVTASPPDVRRGSASPSELYSYLGLRPLAGPAETIEKSPSLRAQPKHSEQLTAGQAHCLTSAATPNRQVGLDLKAWDAGPRAGTSPPS